MKHIHSKLAPVLRFALATASFTAISLYAAKGDKAEKREEKIERKLERQQQQGQSALAEAVAQRQAAAAAAPVDPNPTRERGDGGSSGRSRRSERNSEYREPTTAADSKFDNFRVVVERNIFNPTRIGRTRDRSEEKAPRVDTIALVGTMQSEKGTVAFFDSPDSQYRKTLREGQSVGEFKVVKIQPNEVQLDRSGKPVTLRVSQQLRRPEGADWSVSALESMPDGAATASQSGPASSEPPPIPANASDAVRRMMEARQKQLK